MNNNFCGNCGASLKPNAKFCGKCGNKINSLQQTAPTAEPVPAPDPASLYSYRFLMPANYKKGMLSTKACTLVFSDTQIIAAMVDKKLMNEHIADVKAQSKNDGFFKRTGAVMKSGYTFSERYQTMSPEAILGDTPNNFSIAVNRVEKVKFRRGTTSYDTDDMNTSTPPTLIVKLPGEKYTFTTNMSGNSKELIKTLLELFPGRYKGPKR